RYQSIRLAGSFGGGEVGPHGNAGTGGTANDPNAGSGGGQAAATASDSSCSCRLPGKSTHASAPWAALLGALWLGVARRRRKAH
ncbi:MAG: MYXO-CTERM sorting domain-containing protein, partial [Polyangiaceae bacterium]